MTIVTHVTDVTDVTRGKDVTGPDGARSKNASPTSPRVLIPYDRREGMTLAHAATVAGKSVATVRRWCIEHHIGRRVGGGEWVVSRVALAMLLDGDEVALAAYLSGDRESDIVVAYFSRVGVTAYSDREGKSFR